MRLLFTFNRIILSFIGANTIVFLKLLVQHSSHHFTSLTFDPIVFFFERLAQFNCKTQVQQSKLMVRIVGGSLRLRHTCSLQELVYNNKRTALVVGYRCLLFTAV